MLLIGLIMRGNGEQMDIPALGTLGEHLLVEVELIVAVKLIQRIEIFYILRVSVGIDEREFHFVRLVLELKVESTLQLARFSQQQRTFSGNPRPLGPPIGLSLLNLTLPVDWSIALGKLVLRELLGT